jgi:hypothetical protein
MPRRRAKSAYEMPRVAQKRDDYDTRTRRATRAAKISAKAATEKVEYVEDNEGNLARVWKPSELQSYGPKEVAAVLRGQHVVMACDLLQWIQPGAIKWAVTKGWLFHDKLSDTYRVTRKAAADLDLPRSRQGRKIHFYDGGLTVNR